MRSLVPIPLLFLAAALSSCAENRFLPGRRSAIRGDEADWQPERRRPRGLRRSLKSRSSSISASTARCEIVSNQNARVFP